MTGVGANRTQKGVQQYGQYGMGTYQGTEGRIVARGSGQTRMTNVWWVPNGTDTETMFSKRADGVWRAFPGPADGPGLVSDALP